MINKISVQFCTFVVVFFALPLMALAQQVGVFYDTNNEQMKFAAGDVKVALEEKSFTVEILPLSALSSAYANEKVVLALATDTSVTGILAAQGGTTPTGLGEQAYALRTTTTGKTSYWVLGGDVSGSMYGGLQIAENIKFNGFSKVYNNQEIPTILKRGIKLNLPLDATSPTYDGNAAASSRNAIADVWDMTFWTTYFDEMARNRFNLLSVWSMNPFTSMVHLDDYPDVSIQGVNGYVGGSNTKMLINTMTIQEKIIFWKNVMAYAHTRGFKFYLFNWNVYLSNANGKYGLTNGAVTPANTAYFYKSMKALLETYPDLDGFGVTNGEHGSTTEFLWNSYGKAVYEHCSLNPNRKFNFVHRWHWADFAAIKSLFAPLTSLPNVTFDLSFKYSQAHMYSVAVPQWWSTSKAQELINNGFKTFFTVRNDDFYFNTWGDPDFARDYVKGMVDKGSYYKGFYMGSDGYIPTRNFSSKDAVSKGTLEVQRQWYMNMLWGRLSYNVNTPDDVFKNYLGIKYASVSSSDLFSAWSKASRGIQRTTELVVNNLDLDFKWYPEACFDNAGFVTANKFAVANPGPGSSLCSISSSAVNGCGGKKTSLQLADDIEADALGALKVLYSMNATPNTELAVAVNNIKCMSYLSLYYAYKIRGATYMQMSGESDKKIASFGTAYCYWKRYSSLMDAMFTGQDMQRVKEIPSWGSIDAAVLQEYTSNGGVGIPTCEPTCTISTKTAGCAGSTIEMIGTNSCGGSVTLTAKTATNCNFVNFTDGTTTWTTNPLVVSVTADKQYTATFASSVAPIANFTADVTAITAGTTVNFTDNSTNGPTSWSWSFPGGVPATSTAENPAVVYNVEGQYDVTLTATNTIGSSSQTKTKHIVVGKAGDKVTALTGWISDLDNPKISGSSRLMVVMVMGESTADFAASSVTYGGQVMTKQTDRMFFTTSTSSRTYASIFTLNELGVNAATSGSIAVNWNGTPTSGNSIYSTLLSNVDQTTPVTAVSSNALTGTIVTIPSAMVTATGDMVVLCGATANNNTQSFANGFVKEFESDSGWGDGVGGYKVGTGVAETPSFTQSAGGRMVICAMVVKKLGATLATPAITNASKSCINIYPNPTSGILNIDFPDGESSKEIKVFNVLGQLVYSHNSTSASIQIDIKSLNVKGIVMLQVIDGKKVSNHKIIVN